jgi:hypothetical protein|tara:strand:+ start:49 stop:273 length:225 start_codon:yes stop_codon:yes gene_type:complete
MTPETLNKWQIVPRIMMLVMTGVYIRCIEYALSQPELSTQMASLISVVTGAMTGSFAVFINKESKGVSNDRSDP